MTKKLLDFFPDLLTEASAGEEAKKRGLKSIGFGRYVDPSDPKKVVAKSKNGKLVSVGSSEKSDISGAMAQVKDIDKRNQPERNLAGRSDDQMRLNKLQGNTLRKIFGKGINLEKIKTVQGQQQMWWNVSETGIHNAAMNRKFQQWQTNKLAKVKRAIAADPKLEGWGAVFMQDKHTGVHLVMAKG